LSDKDITTFKPFDLKHKTYVVFNRKLPPSNFVRFPELVALGRQPYTNWIGNFNPEDITEVNEALGIGTQIVFTKFVKTFPSEIRRTITKVLIARALAQDTR